MPSHTLGLISATDMDIIIQLAHGVTFRSERSATTCDCCLSVGAGPITGRMGRGKVHARYRVVKGKQHAGVGNHNCPISPRLLTPLHVHTR